MSSWWMHSMAGPSTDCTIKRLHGKLDVQKTVQGLRVQEASPVVSLNSSPYACKIALSVPQACFAGSKTLLGEFIRNLVLHWAQNKVYKEHLTSPNLVSLKCSPRATYYVLERRCVEAPQIDHDHFSPIRALQTYRQASDFLWNGPLSTLHLNPKP